MSQKIYDDEYIVVYDGKTVSYITLTGNSMMTVEDGGTANYITVTDFSEIEVQENGIVNNTVVEDNGWLQLESGGTANDTIVNFDGFLITDYDSTVKNTTVNKFGYVSIGGFAEDTTICTDGALRLLEGGILKNITVKSNAFIEVDAGGYAENIIFEPDSYFHITVAHDTYLKGKSHDYNFSIIDGTLDGCMSVDKYSYIAFTENCTTDDIIENGGYVHVEDGADVTFVPNILENFELPKHGKASVHRNTVLLDFVNHGGMLHVFEGGFVTGEFFCIDKNSTVIFEDGSFFEFDLRGRTPSSPALINDYEYIDGSPQFSITVDAENQEFGTYLLAEHAKKFNTSISVTVGDSEEIYGTIKADGKKVILNNTTYSLFKADNNLYFSISSELPDLTIKAVLADDHVIVGESLPITFTVTNKGNAAAEASVIHIYDGETVLKTFNVPALNAGESHNTISYFTPNGSYIGKLSLTAVADGEEKIKESAENNNSVLYSLEILDQPDLSASVTFSSDEIYFNESSFYSLDVTNIGGSDAENFYISVYLNDTLQDEIFIEKLSAGSTYHQSFSILPEALPLGETTVIVKADSKYNVKEKKEDNNTAQASLLVKGLPDWIITSFEIKPEIIKKGTDSTLYITVQNAGNASSDAAELTLYFGDTIIDKIKTAPAGINQSQSFTIPFNSSELPTGNYSIKASIDSNDDIKESNELNNSDSLFFSVTLPDLIVSEAVASKKVLDKNDATCINFKIKNIGKVAANDSITTVICENWQRTCAVRNLFPDDETSGFVIIPSVYFDKPGEYFVTVTADGTFVIEETNEINNHQTVRLIYNPTEEETEAGNKKLPDLTISNLEIDKNKPSSGDFFNFCYSVTNVGNAGVSDSLLYIYVDEQKIAEINIDSLQSGETYYGEYKLNLQSLTYGEHTVILYADGDEQITESDEKNNKSILKFNKNFIIEESENRAKWVDKSPEGYIIDHSQNFYNNILRVHTHTAAIDRYGLPQGIYQWRVKEKNTPVWHNGQNIISTNSPDVPQQFISDGNGDMDLFFADASGIWEDRYAAKHAGNINGTKPLGTVVELKGKNKFTNIFEGGTDANILILTDTENGDAVFADDIYSASPVSAPQIRLANINEIRAGLGDDVIDFTSSQFEYTGDGTTIYGGLGNDTIWAGDGENKLFGDGGNDYIIGGKNNDIIVGGSGNDTLHGGGGDDIFVFGGNFGSDTVEQFSDGKITLYFDSANIKWDDTSQSYTDGQNSVKVTGSNDITVKYEVTDELASISAFKEFVSEKIFEDADKVMIA